MKKRYSYFLMLFLSSVQLSFAQTEFKLTASDAAAGDQFGECVSISGDYAVVGAKFDDDGGSSSGSAYIFIRNDSSWIEQAKLTASDAAAGDFFGGSVSISGDYAVVGAVADDDFSGSAYIFMRNGSSWIEQAKLTASDAAAGDFFGRSVSISGGYAVVGAFINDDAEINSGSAYIFMRNGSSWIEQAKLTASDAAANDLFGRSVSISGDYAVVGAVADDDFSGSAYIFMRNGSSWIEQAKLTASDAAAGDEFGGSVSISGDYAVVGAVADDDFSGSAYIFMRNGSSWIEQAKLTASDAAAGDEFGRSVSISGDYAVVGAARDDDAGFASGSAYIFMRSGSSWIEQAKLTASGAAAGDEFGRSVSISGDYAVGGALEDDAGVDSGSAYVYLLPVLSITPDSLDFGSSTDSLTFAITNSGVGVLEWMINAEQSWITVNPDNGSTTREIDTVTVNINRSGLNSGSFSESITVNSNGGSKKVFIRVTVPNRSPVVTMPLPDTSLSSQSLIQNLDNIFTDPEGDKLAYEINSNAPDVAIASLNQSITLIVTPVTPGIAMIIVTANDSISTAVADTFTVAVVPSSLTLSQFYSFPTRSKPSDYQKTEYQIIGIPGASGRLVSNFLSGKQDDDWQVFWDDGTADKFFIKFNGTSTFQFSVGRAFWVIQKGPLNINVISPTAPLNNNQEVKIPLHSAWNLITNPYDSTIVWRNIQTVNNLSEPIYSYSGNFSIATNFEPYIGYYFFNATNLNSLSIPYSLIFTETIPSKNKTQALWRVHITLSSAGFIDETSSFGVSNKASPGLDQLDFRKPRAIAETPTVSFNRPDWDANFSTFATDIRSDVVESEIWEFEVRSIPQENATLTFSDIKQIPAHFEVYLLDVSRARSINLRENSLYSFIPVGELTKFSVVVGDEAAVKEQLNSVSLPRQFSLGHNYPNPFNPTTIIPVAVPVTSEITLKIYDILGKEVKTVYQGPIDAGHHLMSWNGRNETGNAVTTGIYLYRLTTAKGVTLLGKMILMK